MKRPAYMLLAGLMTATAVAAAPPAPTTAPSAPNETAAVYREAFERMKGLSAEDSQRLGLCGKDGCWVVTTPLDVAAGDLVKRQAGAIELARKAASMPPARWGIDGDAQLMIDLANRGPRLSALLVLQARHAFRDGKTEQAVDDVVAAMALSRHCATDATFMSRLVEVTAWRPAADLLAQQLPSLPRELVAGLPARLDRLPPSPAVRESVLAEKAFAKRAARRQGVTMVVMVESLNDLYDAAADNAKLPPDAFAGLIDEQAAKYPLNAWAKVITPSMKNTRASLAVFETKQAMLSAAIGIVVDGDGAIDRSKDPFGDGPFTCHKRQGGFELESALKSLGEPVKLVVGDPG